MFGFPLKAIIIAGIVLAVLASYGVTYLAGDRNGARREALNTERAVAAERDRQQRANADILSEARRQFEVTRSELAANQQRVDDLEAEKALQEAELDLLRAEDAASPTASTTPACRCSTNPPISPSDAEKLNAIR
jgi:hypothetical protein